MSPRAVAVAVAVGVVWAGVAAGPAAAQYRPAQPDPIHPPDDPTRGFYARQAEYFRRQAKYFEPQYRYYDRMLERHRPVYGFAPHTGRPAPPTRPYDPYPSDVYIPYLPGLPLPAAEAAVPPAGR